jgi:hypothetical protein
MSFPQDLLRFLFLVIFKPFTFHKMIDQLDPTLANVSLLLSRTHNRAARPFKQLAIFHLLVSPWLLALGTALIFSASGMDVNWLRLGFALLVAIGLSTTLNLDFAVAFLLPFSVLAGAWSATSYTPILGILLSLALGLVYGRGNNSARWGFTAALVYGVVLSLISNPWTGLGISAAYLTGYFRIPFYIVEAPIAWFLGTKAMKGNAARLWQSHPVRWDEVIWFPLPRLDDHLRALEEQEPHTAREAMQLVRNSFRQKWAVQQMSSK